LDAKLPGHFGEADMQTGVGYSENPDTEAAGVEAAAVALDQAGGRCDLVLLFATALHDQHVLRAAVASVTGDSTPIVGGGAAGIITNEAFGYAGYQVGVACLLLDGVCCELVTDDGLLTGEEASGERLGRRLAAVCGDARSPVLLFYDAIDRSGGGIRMLMATWLLAGLQKGLGFFPELAGAGLLGDHACSPTAQYTGAGIAAHSAMALAFSGDIRMDSAIMHGCRPASPYYTVTRAEGPVILEINGQPALRFLDELLEGAVAPEAYPFFLIFGINHGDMWGEYNENDYASRLCLAIDKERDGIVMFEPDMVAGTEFQIMHRSLELDYMKPKIESLFAGLDGRKPVFGLYIDCAGRCAGYGGMDMEDAVMLQKVVKSRVPVLGFYTGVEIAPIGGCPRGLDWTGVFCLFSQRGDSREDARELPGIAHAWDERAGRRENAGGAPVPLSAVLRLSERNAAKILSLDTQAIAIRHELELKRRGFSLLAELSVSLRRSADYRSIFVLAAQRMNVALNMQRTAVLVPDGKGLFMPFVLHGWSMNERADFAGRHISVEPELLDPEHEVLVTGADSDSRLASLRRALGLPFLISSPVLLGEETAALLITGRLVEQPPYLSRLSRSDMETVRAVSSLLAAVLASRRLIAAEERSQILLHDMPLCCVFWNEHGNQTDCNQEALRLFGLADKRALLENFYALSPEYQPDGRHSETTLRDLLLKTFVFGNARFEWTFRAADGGMIPSEVSLVRAPHGENYIMAGYIRDLREHQAALAELREARDQAERGARVKSEFLAAVSHEIRTPLHAILAMARAASEGAATEQGRKLIAQGKRSARLLSAIIDSILDFSRLDAGRVKLESEAFSVRDMITHLADVLRGEAEAKSLYLRLELDPDVPEFVLGDTVRLEQTLFNIASNAVKFTETGGVTIHVQMVEIPQADKVRLAFMVRDTGIGLAPEHAAALYKPFTQGNTAYTRKYGGLGMGLAVSQSLATLMGGEIICESRLGEGSLFTLTLTLPLPAASALEKEEDAPKAASGYAQLQGMRVLVAEDNPINQMIAEELLTSAGIHTSLVDNGLAALEELRNRTFDLVLMDIQMPEMDGLTATAKIRSDPRHSAMPILAMTAHSTEEDREASFKSGMNDHLTKPIEAEGLYAALLRWDRRGGE
jgi:signal transduction histidine kinase/ActR/RegA family two-component response regulator